jgi:hypothetical protein
MKTAYAIGISLLVLNTGCLKPAKTVQAQKAQLSDTIRFANLTVAGSSVLFELARDDSGKPTSRQADIPAVDFPEYVAFEKTDAAGKLRAVRNTSSLTVSDAECTDSACTGIQMRLTRAGGTLGDTAMIKVGRVTGMNCPIQLNEANGEPKNYVPTFDTATVTTTMTLDPIACIYLDSNTAGIYGKTTYTDKSTNYLTNITLRSLIGTSALWLDVAQNAIQSDGRLSRVSTMDYTLGIYDQNFGTNDLGYFASDVDGRRLSMGCTSTSVLKVKAATPDPVKYCVPKAAASPVPSPIPSTEPSTTPEA